MQTSNGYYRPTFTSKDENRFKFTTFDELINPLRADHPFGKCLHFDYAIFGSSSISFKTYKFNQQGF
jgi:hypothetical protein